MKQIRLGRSDLQVSRIAFETWQLGGGRPSWRWRACTSWSGPCSTGSTTCRRNRPAAMRGAIGLGPPSGDRLLITIALLTLLADLAEESELLAESQGNPLALIVLSGQLAREQRRGPRRPSLSDPAHLASA